MMWGVSVVRSRVRIPQGSFFDFILLFFYFIFDQHRNDWGASQWANKITDLLYDASADSTLLLAQTLLGYNFHRLDPVFTKDIHTLPLILLFKKKRKGKKN